MNLLTISTTNQKGQLVIPQKIRKALGINPQTPLQLELKGGSLVIHPLEGVIRKVDHEDSYLKILEATAGSWGKPSKQELEKEKALEKAAIKEAQEAKKPW